MSRSSSPFRLRAKLRQWRTAIMRAIGGPQSITVLALDPQEVALDPQEVARRLNAVRSTSA
jgi:hypothetical protein